MDVRKAIAGSGAWTIALALQIIPPIWPTLLHPHPWLVVFLILGGAVMIGYVTIAHKSSEERPSNFVGRDNSGKMFSAQTINYHEAAPLEPEEFPPILQKIIDDRNQQMLNAIDRQRVALKCWVEMRSIVYDLESSSWVDGSAYDHESKRAILVWFQNPIPPVGSSALNTSAMCAHIRFSVSGNWESSITRAYWFKYSENQISLGIGHEAAVILGMMDWNKWICYSNPYETPASEEFLQPACRRHSQKKQMPSADMDVEVSLISGNETIEQKKMKLVFTGDTPFVVTIP